jgi:protein-tyrosine phosphatase
MIDLHCHILPGLDDGPGDLEASVEMARVAVENGIETTVATPHVSLDYPTAPDDMSRAVGTLNLALVRRGIPLAVLPGAELAPSRLVDTDDATLAQLALAGGRTVLVESPYVPGMPWLEDLLFDLQARGFKPVLAHPERSPLFQQDPARLARVVQRGVCCSITAASLAGRFGSRVKHFSLRLVSEGLVHDIASDAHDHERRLPSLLDAFAAAEAEIPGISEHADWFTRVAPEALLAGKVLPAPPALAMSKGPVWKRFARRR